MRAAPSDGSPSDGLRCSRGILRIVGAGAL